MNRSTIVALLLTASLIALLAGCESLPAGPARDNPSDPDSPYWVAQRPFIYSVAKTTDGKVEVKWISNNIYGVSYTVQRRIANTGAYTTIGSLPGPLTTGAFIDGSSLTTGTTYAYRVAVVGSAGAVTWSYDFPIDI